MKHENKEALVKDLVALFCRAIDKEKEMVNEDMLQLFVSFNCPIIGTYWPEEYCHVSKLVGLNTHSALHAILDQPEGSIH